MERIAGWWDGFELWVAGLPFLPQFLVVLAGMIPVSLALAYLLDRVLRTVLRVIGRDRAGSGQRPPVAPESAAVPEESRSDEPVLPRPRSPHSEIRQPGHPESELGEPEPAEPESAQLTSTGSPAPVLPIRQWETV